MAKYICSIDDAEYTVEAPSNVKAKQAVAHLYRKDTKKNYPIGFLIEHTSCRLKERKPAGRPKLERPENFGKKNE